MHQFKNMKRSLKSVESEIVNQIWISELCFDICNSIKIIPWRWNDFLPYYYNLNFIKWIISLHSLLLSTGKDELSINNYIKEHKLEFPKVDIEEFKKTICSITEEFKTIFYITDSKGKKIPIPLRHKIGAHIAESFEHTHFTSAYIMPVLIQKHIEIIKNLKNTFFDFCNWSKDQYPFWNIKQQSNRILKYLINNS